GNRNRANHQVGGSPDHLRFGEEPPPCPPPVYRGRENCDQVPASFSSLSGSRSRVDGRDAGLLPGPGGCQNHASQMPVRSQSSERAYFFRSPSGPGSKPTNIPDGGVCSNNCLS